MVTKCLLIFRARCAKISSALVLAIRSTSKCPLTISERLALLSGRADEADAHSFPGRGTHHHRLDVPARGQWPATAAGMWLISRAPRGIDRSQSQFPFRSKNTGCGGTEPRAYRSLREPTESLPAGF